MDIISFVIPKASRVINEIIPILTKIGINLEGEFYDDKSLRSKFNKNTRKLIFFGDFIISDKEYKIKLIVAKNSDVPKFVNIGTCDFGISGRDVFDEEGLINIKNLVDLNIGKCRFSIAKPKNLNVNLEEKESIKIATKYVNITKKLFTKEYPNCKNLDIIKLNGSVEIAPLVGICDCIADIVDTGNTLEENNLKEEKKLIDISSYFIGNKNFIENNGKISFDIIKKIRGSIK